MVYALAVSIVIKAFGDLVCYGGFYGMCSTILRNHWNHERNKGQDNFAVYFVFPLTGGESTRVKQLEMGSPLAAEALMVSSRDAAFP